MPLIAYNINLNTDRLDVAKKIAAAIRHSSGGFRYVKAAGFKLEDRGIVQVSMNLTNYQKTPIFRVFEMVKREAERYGVVDPRERDRRAGPVGRAGQRGRVLPAARTASARDQILENKLRAELDVSASGCQLAAPLPSAAGAIPNARILRYRLLRSTPSASAVREMLPCCAASARRM